MIFGFTCWKIIISWNIVVASIYSYDKFLSVWFGRRDRDSGGVLRGQHRQRRRYFLRVSEDSLLLLLFAFGPIGAWLAMEVTRHKTRKSNFRRRAVLLTVVNPLWLIVYWTLN